MEDVPAAFRGLFLLGAPRRQGRPVHGLDFDVHADVTKELSRYERRVVEDRDVRGLHHDDLLEVQLQ